MAFLLAIRDGRHVQNMRVEDRVTIGQAETNEIRISAGGGASSHAVLRQEGAVLVITDLDAEKGLQVDGRRVAQALVDVGTDIMVGHARITVIEIEEDPLPAAAADADTVTVDGAGDPAPSRRTSRVPQRVRRAARMASARGREEADRRRNAAAAAFAFPASAPSGPVPRLVSARGGLRQQLAAPQRLHVLRDFARRSPWIAGALVAHLALLVVLSFVEFTSGDAYAARSGVITLEDETATLELDDAPDTVDDEREDPLDSEPEPEVELLPEEPPLEPLPEEEIPEDAFEPVTEDDLTPEPLAFEAAGTIGIGATDSLTGVFGKDGAQGANRSAAGTLEGSPFGRAQIQGLRKRASAANVVVVKGTYDTCEDVLHLLEVRHGWMTREKLSMRGVPPHVRAVFINCARESLTGRATLNLRDFVARGGYLFTTDWGVENVLEAAFPEYVQPLRSGGRKVMTKDETIGFHMTGRHALLRGMPDSNETFRMWLEDSTLPLHLPNPDRVEVLMSSTQMHARHGSPHVTVTFEYGRGRVVHSVGHLFQKEGNLRGTVAMQRLLVNFLHQALKR